MVYFSHRSVKNLSPTRAGHVNHRLKGAAHDRTGKISSLPPADTPEIPAELESLRQAGKEKTVKFKELLAEKLTVEMILLQLRYAGLEE